MVWGSAYNLTLIFFETNIIMLLFAVDLRKIPPVYCGEFMQTKPLFWKL
jgi:hypothetical protein